MSTIPVLTISGPIGIRPVASLSTPSFSPARA
jgi:hypothetical protein